MADGISPERFYAALQALESRLGDKIDNVGVRLENKLDAHAADDLLVANRVLVIETERDAEKKLAMKHGTWAGLGAGGVVSLTIEAVRHWWK